MDMREQVISAWPVIYCGNWRDAKVFQRRVRIQVAAGLDLVDRPDMALKTVHSLVLEESESEIADAWYNLGYYIGR